MPDLTDEQRAQLEQLTQQREALQALLKPVNDQLVQVDQQINELMHTFRRGVREGRGGQN